MLPVNGLFGHVRKNDLRSLVFFLGFAVAIQLLAATVATLPLLMLDTSHVPLFAPLSYLWRYGWIVLLWTCALFVYRYERYLDDLRDTMGFGMGFSQGDQRLARVAHELAITAGVPPPRVAVIETGARNAFACGTKPEDSIIVATRGLLDALDDRELRAVIAHEISHIRHGDIRFMASAHVLFGIMLSLQRKQKLRMRGGALGCLAVFTPLVGFPMVIGSMGSGIAFLIARATRSGISLSREFIADAESVRLTHDPAALISALKKVSGRSRIESLQPELEAMMIDGSATGAAATHPTIADRIAALVALTGPMAAEPYRSEPVTPAPRGFGRRGLVAAPEVEHPVRPIGSGHFDRPAEPERNGDEAYVLKVLGNSKAAKQFLIILAIMALYLFIVRGGNGAASGGGPFRSSNESSSAEVVQSRNTGCFPEYVQIASNGVHPVSYDKSLIDGSARPDSGIHFEQYLRWHRATLTRFEIEGSSRDEALVDYTRTRKIAFEQAHDLFGPAGVEAIKREYDSPGDARLLAALRDRLRSSAPMPLKDEVTLATSPARFVPCRSLSRKGDAAGSST